MALIWVIGKAKRVRVKLVLIVGYDKCMNGMFCSLPGTAGAPVYPALHDSMNNLSLSKSYYLILLYSYVSTLYE